MNEPTLWQFNVPDNIIPTEGRTKVSPYDGLTWNQVFEQAEKEGMLVPVERCEHGNYAEHIIDRPEKQGFVIEWCPGAGIVGSDES